MVNSDSDSLEILLVRSQELAGALARVKQEQSSTFAKVKARLQDLAARHQQAFGFPGYDEDLHPSSTDIEASDHLGYWSIEKGYFHARFEYTFRGELNDYCVCWPEKYLTEKGLASIEKDARARQAQEALKAVQQKEAQAQAEREHYFALKQRFEPNDNLPPATEASTGN